MLTSNATHTNLIRQGVLTPVDVLSPSEMPGRYLWATSVWIDWMTNKLPALPRLIDPQLTPLEQVSELLRRYSLGKPLVHRREFHALDPLSDGVWELKTPDTRIFGFFTEKNKFIGTNACDADTVKRLRLYNSFANEVVRVRNGLNLPFMSGRRSHDVVS